MGKFQFRLEKVWRHRRRIVDENSLAVAAADRKVAALSRLIVEIQGRIDRHRRLMTNPEGSHLRPEELISATTWLENLHRQEDELDLELQGAVRELEHLRARLNDSWRDLEVLSRLRDRQADNWRLEQVARERKEMDEIGQIRAFGRGPKRFSP